MHFFQVERDSEINRWIGSSIFYYSSLFKDLVAPSAKQLKCKALRSWSRLTLTLTLSLFLTHITPTSQIRVLTIKETDPLP